MEDGMVSSRFKAIPAILLVLSFAVTVSRAQAQSGSEADSAAIKKAVAAFSDAFNRHDPHGCVARYVEDGDFSGLSGTVSHGSKELEQHYTSAFTGSLKNVRSTFTVKRIRFVTPDIAGVDLTWSAAGSLAADGSINPVRNGLINLLMTKHNGQWLITIYHESELPPPSPK
jgi:uncharacterized protein (TIGR02246 family)